MQPEAKLEKLGKRAKKYHEASSSFRFFKPKWSWAQSLSNVSSHAASVSRSKRKKKIGRETLQASRMEFSGETWRFKFPGTFCNSLSNTLFLSLSFKTSFSSFFSLLSPSNEVENERMPRAELALKKFEYVVAFKTFWRDLFFFCRLPDLLLPSAGSMEM